ncbi:MAG: pyridoxamine 5'-phosphate oxidase family protein [Gammaproteobacteria bacterium (ex Lamellibrachia satsuma)]|nr:MAG: pyridoxamine 5'-phosphate oxidase family protein [Gammaproteobacteria bacterium (ex Lamellibrachia satsuma)]
MKRKTSDVLFSQAVRAVQEEQGSRDYIDRLESRGHWKAELSEEQMAFVRSRDSFYFGTADKQGRSYIQHRGGPEGFLQVVSSSALWFPDFGGNRQYITVGNLSENEQAFIFLMDYANRRRLKLWGRAWVLATKDLSSTTNDLGGCRVRIASSSSRSTRRTRIAVATSHRATHIVGAESNLKGPSAKLSN